ncbi:hypothetical protein FHU23_004303 [Clostridium saccharobutylicum]|nr:hypothetical protein [Clostridium saccharobutylicum]MBA8792124.1 hypothetical protein [Clostridium saccharobutylicum]MBA8898865.1 hypothetical protein [Clostridium saccharobutylicum]MBA8996351.1 hypothetical protein [Clostridium saccharobutylicum]NOW57550.1 hypothetical protein [Clostridium saccharobutylicum]
MYSKPENNGTLLRSLHTELDSIDNMPVKW